MATILSKQKQSLIDVTAKGFGRIDDIVSVSKKNRVSITDELLSNDSITVENTDKGIKEVKNQNIDFNNSAVSTYKTEANKALRWAELQMLTVVNSEGGYFIAFDGDYDYNYTGEVTGKFIVPPTLESIPPDVSITSPSSLLNTHTGTIAGTISLLQPENYEVRIYKKTDIEYHIGTVPVNSSGEWTFGGTGSAGIFVFRIFKV